VGLSEITVTCAHVGRTSWGSKDAYVSRTKLGRVAGTPQWVAQAGKGDRLSLGRLK